jgi:transcriptional regulator with XRE-family HTH domain
MTMSTPAKNLAHEMDRQRRKLRMSYAALSKRSGVSAPTIMRTLSGRNLKISVENLLAIAEALGVEIGVKKIVKPSKLKEDQARRKAKQLVGMVQGTSGLEAQAVDRDTVKEMTTRTYHELLAGSPRRLWGE